MINHTYAKKFFELFPDVSMDPKDSPVVVSGTSMWGNEFYIDGAVKYIFSAASKEITNSFAMLSK